MFDTVAALEGLAAASRAECAAVARKLALAAEVGQAEAECGDGSDFAAMGVATALSVSTGAAHVLMYLGDVLQVRLPGVRRALEAGELDLVRVRVIVDRTVAITDLVVLAEVERRVLAAVTVPGRCVTRGQVQRAVDRVVAVLDPGSVIEQRRRAVADRRIDVRADLDGMSSVWGVVPAGDGAVLDARLRTMALAVCGADPRTLAQRRADALVAWASGNDALACECGAPTCPSAPAPAPAPVVQVVVDAATLLGAADLPGVLARYGVVDPELVRTLAADARWQRMLTVDGVPVHLGPLVGPGRGADTPAALRHTPGEKLAALVRTRDSHCRFPGCTVPAASCDLDHTVPFDHDAPRRGGRTVVENLACLCRWHHRAKTEGHWQVVMHRDGVQHWTGPHGQQRHSVPTGMPPTTSNTPTGDCARSDPVAGPVLPRHRRRPDLLTVHRGGSPDERRPDDFPPDDDPPVRWTTEGHWANDPISDRELEDALDTLLRDIDRWDRDQRITALIGSGTPSTTARADPNEPAPF